jgi:hypothetical protein
VRVSQQMDQIIALLKKEQFGDAIERQADLVKHLRQMLELLQSEDRRSELDKEKERIQNLLKELNKNIAGQKDVRAGGAAESSKLDKRRTSPQHRQAQPKSTSRTPNRTAESEGRGQEPKKVKKEGERVKDDTDPRGRTI